MLYGILISLGFISYAPADNNVIYLEPTQIDCGEYQVCFILENTPSWYCETDPDARSFILRRIYKISMYSDDDIRKGIIKFINENNLTNEYGDIFDEQFAKIVLLSKVIFAVPEYVAKDELAKGCYNSTVMKHIGSNSEFMYNSLYPLNQNIDGELTIISCTSDLWYPLDMRHALEEFDYYRTKYGRAKLEKHDDGRIYRFITPVQNK